eukprot:UN02816
MAKATVTKAAAAAKAQQQTRARKTKVYTTPAFHRPRTLRLRKQGLYRKKAVAKTAKDNYQIIQVPVFTDAAMKNMEKANVLTFMVDTRATKDQIKRALKSLYDVKVVKVNTLIMKTGKKKAYAKLDAATTALSVANRIGLI